MDTPIIKITNIIKSFQVGQQVVPILKDISLEIKKGDFVIIIGPSGCGKSTFLHTILGLEPPTSGKIMMLQKNLYEGRTEDDIAEFRKQHIGMVYQQPNWIKSLTVIDNITFPLLLLGGDQVESVQRASKVLDTIGMLNWAFYMPTELSSGQQQRIALARAMVTDPEIIIADEPTGNLDYEAGQMLMKLLGDLSTQGKTIVMVTHDLEYLKYAKTAVRMFDGQIVGVYTEKDKDKLEHDIKSKRGIAVND